MVLVEATIVRWSNSWNWQRRLETGVPDERVPAGCCWRGEIAVRVTEHVGGTPDGALAAVTVDRSGEPGARAGSVEVERSGFRRRRIVGHGLSEMMG